MKVHVKVSGSGPAIFGGGSQTVETKISVSEHMNADTAALTDLVGALTVSANAIARAIIHADEPDDGDAERVGETAESEPKPEYVVPGDPDWDEAQASGEDEDGKGNPEREHPGMPTVRDALADAVLTFEEADEVRALALVAQKRGEGRGIRDGR